MFHANGWTFVWLATARGAAHVCLRKVDPAAIFRLVGEEGVTTLCAAPTVLIGIANAPAEAARARARGKKVRLLTAGAPPAAVTIDRIERELGWEVLHVYGMTETSPLILLLRAAARARKAFGGRTRRREGAPGRRTRQLRRDPRDGRGRRRRAEGRRTLGEICVRGNVVMKGYSTTRKRPQLRSRAAGCTRATPRSCIPTAMSRSRTDSRTSSSRGGENISSVEVEGVLLAHPAVQEVSVVGMKHERWGEAPHAFVVLRQGGATEAELRQFARENLAHFKVPQWVSFVTELPKTATGKIQKFVLRGRSPGIVAQ